MSKAYLREDILREQGFPYSYHFCNGRAHNGQYFWEKKFEYWIPESLSGLNEGSEYNMVLSTERWFVLVNSIDFDFDEE